MSKTWTDPDVDGFIPVDSGLLGTIWKHFKTHKEYKIVGFIWFGNLDLWLIVYQDIGGNQYARTVANFMEELPAAGGSYSRFNIVT